MRSRMTKGSSKLADIDKTTYYLTLSQLEQILLAEYTQNWTIFELNFILEDTVC